MIEQATAVSPLIPVKSKTTMFLLHNPAVLLTVFGMILMLIALLGAKRVKLPILKAGIDFSLDEPLRVPAFIVGAICIGAGIYLCIG